MTISIEEALERLLPFYGDLVMVGYGCLVDPQEALDAYELADDDTPEKVALSVLVKLYPVVSSVPTPPLEE